MNVVVMLYVTCIILLVALITLFLRMQWYKKRYFETKGMNTRLINENYDNKEKIDKIRMIINSDTMERHV